MRRCLAGLLALGLTLLSGCGLSRQRESAGLLETAAGLDAPCAVAEAGGVSIGSRSYLYWLGRNCEYLAEALRAQGREVQWNQGTRGETLGDTAKAAALRTAALYALLPELAEEYGAALDDADVAAIAESRRQRVEAAGGEEAWARQLARWGLSETDADAFAQCHRLYAKLFTLSRTEGSALCPSPEELADYAKAQGLCTVGILAAADAQRAEALRAELAGSGDLPAAFAAKAETANLLPYGEVTLGDGEDSLPEAVVQAARALTPGQLSAVVTAEGRSYLLLGRETDGEAAARGLFDRRLDQRVEAAEIRLLAAYEAIDPGKFYPALTAAQAALDASGGEAPAAGSGAGSGSAAGSGADGGSGAAAGSSGG
mgnify:CR=1 FL=1